MRRLNTHTGTGSDDGKESADELHDGDCDDGCSDDDDKSNETEDGKGDISKHTDDDSRLCREGGRRRARRETR